jgi:hypothetical protein
MDIAQQHNICTDVPSSQISDLIMKFYNVLNVCFSLTVSPVRIFCFLLRVFSETQTWTSPYSTYVHVYNLWQLVSVTQYPGNVLLYAKPDRNKQAILTTKHLINLMQYDTFIEINKWPVIKTDMKFDYIVITLVIVKYMLLQSRVFFKPVSKPFIDSSNHLIYIYIYI